MEFTLTFIKLFGYGLYLAAPLLLVFSVFIILVGLWVGRKEGWPRFDALYWSFITATTVGYGDIRPVRKSSRVLALLIALLGVMLTGIIVALAINAASESFKAHNDVANRKRNIEQIMEHE